MEFKEAMCEIMDLTENQLESINITHMPKEFVKETIINTHAACMIMDKPEAMKEILLEELELIKVPLTEKKLKEEEDRLSVHYLKEDDMVIYCPICFAKQMFTFDRDTDFKDRYGKIIPYSILICCNCKKRYKLVRYKTKNKVTDIAKQADEILR